MGAIPACAQFWSSASHFNAGFTKEDDSTFPWEGMHIVPVLVIQKKGCPEVVKASNNFLSWML